MLLKSQVVLKTVQISTQKKNFGMWLDHTCRIFLSIKAWSKRNARLCVFTALTVTATCGSTWLWFSFPQNMRSLCCRHKLISFFLVAYPESFCSAMQRWIPLESIVVWHIYMISPSYELGEENLKEMTEIWRLAKTAWKFQEFRWEPHHGLKSHMLVVVPKISN